MTNNLEGTLLFCHFVISPAFSQMTLAVVEIGGKPQFCQPGLVLGPEFGVTFPSWLTSTVFLTFDCLLKMSCVCFFVDDLWRVSALFRHEIIGIVCVMDS